jgi:microcompartment protein CcmK/EutM
LLLAWQVVHRPPADNDTRRQLAGQQNAGADMKRILITTTTIAFGFAAQVHAQTTAPVDDFVAAVVDHFTREGYDAIEVSADGVEVTVEALRDGYFIETVYDASSGEVLFHEVEEHDDDDEEEDEEGDIDDGEEDEGDDDDDGDDDEDDEEDDDDGEEEDDEDDENDGDGDDEDDDAQDDV